jgi:hypothetical protein
MTKDEELERIELAKEALENQLITVKIWLGNKEIREYLLNLCRVREYELKVGEEK